MVVYQFDVDEELWNRWKDTVPRSKTLDERLRELIEADADGRVVESPAESGATPSEPEPAPESETDDADRDGPPQGPDDLAPGEDPPETLLSDDQEAMLRERLTGSGAKLDGRVDAVRVMYGRLRVLGEAERDELLGPVNIEATGYAHADSVWSNVVKGKDTLSELPGVSVDQTGTWRYDPEAADE